MSAVRAAFSTAHYNQYKKYSQNKSNITESNLTDRKHIDSFVTSIVGIM